MGDLKVGETFEDRVYIVNSVGAAQTGLSPTCTIIDESGNRGAGTVAEMASGWYKVTDFTPDAAGTWCLEWTVAGAYTVMHPAKMFKVGGGILSDIETELTFQHQTDVTLAQATPDQNTWYTVLDTTLNCRVISIGILVAATGETLQVQAIIDGITMGSSSQAATANTYYYVNGIRAMADNSGTLLVISTTPQSQAFVLEGRSIQIQVRKTTAAGTGTLKSRVCFAKR